MEELRTQVIDKHRPVQWTNSSGVEEQIVTIS